MMKSNLPELTCAMIGSFFAILISAFTYITIDLFAPFGKIAFSVWNLYDISLALSIISFALCFLLVKFKKVVSVLFIVIGIILLLINFLQLIPFTLLIISGILGLYDRLNNNNNSANNMIV